MKIHIKTTAGVTITVEIGAESSLSELNEKFKQHTGEDLFGLQHVISTDERPGGISLNEMVSIYGMINEGSVIYQKIRPEAEQANTRERLLQRTQAEQKSLPFLAFQQLSDGTSVKVDQSLPRLPFVTSGETHSLNLSEIFIKLADNQKQTVQQYIVDKLGSDYSYSDKSKQLVAETHAAVVLVPSEVKEANSNGNYQVVLTDKELIDVPRVLLIKLTLRLVPDETNVYEVCEGGDLKVIWLNQSHILASETKYTATEVSETRMQAMLSSEDKETQKKAYQIKNQHILVITVPISFEPENTHQIFIKPLQRETYTYDVTSNDSIRTIKRMYCQRTGVDPDQARFMFAGKQLEEGRTLENYNIQKESTIHHVLRLRGANDGQDDSCASSYAITTTQVAQVDYVPLNRLGKYEIQTPKAVLIQSMVTESENKSEAYLKNTLHAAEQRAIQLAGNVFGLPANTPTYRYLKHHVNEGALKEGAAEEEEKQSPSSSYHLWLKIVSGGALFGGSVALLIFFPHIAAASLGLKFALGGASIIGIGLFSHGCSQASCIREPQNKRLAHSPG